ncbi:inositol polyphosphate multikinase-like [Musca vetustissima]|uniref:inositol polyphosphate multikinase-like n=1 Tax=Musca vetustissima TaxID=27455 RepID=UPI002AB786DB|nr:inositol polyphosphate multikinase-like [Musca vetustissima]
MNQNQPQLPKGICVLETQVAGHLFTNNTAALGMLKDETIGCVLKPFGKPECGARELSFYENLQQTNDPLLKKLQNFIPKFYKKIRLEVNGKEHTFFQLEDLTHGMQRPCIMDIKVGKRTWDPLASPHKCKVEEEKYARCKQVLGICLPGFQVYTAEGYQKYDRDYGKKLDADGLRAALRMFLNGQERVCEALIEELLRQLYDIREWFREQKYFHFYASSLLIAYDFVALQKRLQTTTGTTTTNGQQQQQREKCTACQKSKQQQQQHQNHQQQHDGHHHHIPNGNSLHICEVADNYDNDDDYVDGYHPSAPPRLATKEVNNQCCCTCLERYVKVKMIDFAHVFPATNNSLDMNYLFGLESLIVILEDMLQR